MAKGIAEMEIKLISGGAHADERGRVSFFNEFSEIRADRFYTVRASQVRQVRGWIGHQREHKWFTALAGTLTVAVVTPDNWQTPSQNLEVRQFTLSFDQPALLHVPPGHATASVMLSPDALLGVFSTGKIEDAASDDYRFAADLWRFIYPSKLVD